MDISASGDGIIGKGENKEINFALGRYDYDVMWKARKALVELRALFSPLELSMAATLFEQEIELLKFQSRAKRGDLLTEHLKLIKDFKEDAEALLETYPRLSTWGQTWVRPHPDLIAHHYKEAGLGMLKAPADIVRGLGRDTILESPLPLIPTRLVGSMVLGIYHGLIDIPDEVLGITTGGAYGSYGETLGRQTLNTAIVVIPVIKGFRAYRARSGGEAAPFEIPDTLPEVWPTRPGGVPASGLSGMYPGLSPRGQAGVRPHQTAVLVLKPVKSSLRSSFETPLQSAVLPKTNPLSQLASDLFPETASSVFSQPYWATLLLLDQGSPEIIDPAVLLERENVVGDPAVLDQKEKPVFVRITRRDVDGSEIVVFVGWVTQEQYESLKNSPYTIAIASGATPQNSSDPTDYRGVLFPQASADQGGSEISGNSGAEKKYDESEYTIFFNHSLSRTLIMVFLRLIRKNHKEQIPEEISHLFSALDATASNPLWTKSQKIKPSPDLLARTRQELTNFLFSQFNLLPRLPKTSGVDRAHLKQLCEEVWGIHMTDLEFKEVAWLARLSDVKRTVIFDKSIEPIVLQWRGFWKRPKAVMQWTKQTVSPSGQSLKSAEMIRWGEALLPEVFNDTQDAFRVFRKAYMLVKRQDGRGFLIVHIPNTTVASEMATHVQIVETGQRIPLIRKSHLEVKNILVADLIIPLEDYPFIQLVFERDTEMLSNLYVDLITGKVFTLPEGGTWQDIMKEPMLDMFRAEETRYESPLFQIIDRYLTSIGELSGIDIRNFSVVNLSYLGHGIFTYRFKIYDFSWGRFVSNSPEIDFIIDMKNRNKPKILECSSKNMPK